MNYKETLCLPKTAFPMRANLPKREPERLAQWDEMGLYGKIQESHADAPVFFLHDGPPYANGHIHLGTALNKILKDFVVKSRSMMGFKAPYRPGWDCHGLPIELQVDRQLGINRAGHDIVSVRKACREYAMKFMAIQREEFKRLGVLGEWDDPYLTMNYDYEADILATFYKIFSAGNIYRGNKPVYWCASCGTALAEAEVEYHDHTSPSIFVAFPITSCPGTIPRPEGKTLHAVIWTTTPWTLPANMAIAVHPGLDYRFVIHGNDAFLVLAQFAETLAKAFNWEPYTLSAPFKGTDLEEITYENSLMKREGRFILADFVTTEAGSGLVHIAPGHGMDDYIVGQKYDLQVLAPVDEKGRFTDEVPAYEGQFVFDANEVILKDLTDLGILLEHKTFSHSYPVCWRCKNPIIFRATEQFFLSLRENDLGKKAGEAVQAITWIPPWGEDRLKEMIENRSDWCISRQRAWGVPIALLRCPKCETLYKNEAFFEEMVRHVRKKGADVWYTDAMDDLVAQHPCPTCGSPQVREMDILDVWFDSGVSHIGAKMPVWPCNLYLEGHDQYRGWFQSSLLLGMAVKDAAPYKSVVTHGFVVDGDGRKMSKSEGNVIAPEDVMKRYGAEVLRLWVAMVDYRDDIPISEEILQRLADAYRKVRNTLRYILGNLNGFSPDEALPVEELFPLDRYILARLHQANEKIIQAYKNYSFHLVYHTLLQLCSVDLSSHYLDMIKDRLYCESEKSRERLSAQTTIYHVITHLLRLMAPVTSFTAEEAYEALPGEKLSSVHLEVFASLSDWALPSEQMEKWQTLFALRKEVMQALETLRAETLRAEQGVGSSLACDLAFTKNAFLDKTIREIPINLEEFFIVSNVTLGYEETINRTWIPSQTVEGLYFQVIRAMGEKCERCWKFKDLEENLCPRCRTVLG